MQNLLVLFYLSSFLVLEAFALTLQHSTASTIIVVLRLHQIRHLVQTQILSLLGAKHPQKLLSKTQCYDLHTATFSKRRKIDASGL